MSIHRFAARSDANQTEIVAALRAAGAGVEIIREPLDLLVSAGGIWIVMEVKRDQKAVNAKSATREKQRAFAERHPHGGPIVTVTDVEGALRALTVARMV